MIFAAFESTNAEGADTTKLLFLQVESIYKTLKSSNDFSVKIIHSKNQWLYHIY